MFSLSGKSKNQIPCFPCAVATLTNSAIHQSGGSLATGRFTVSTGTIPKNGHIPSMGERPGEAVASGGLPAAGLVNSTVTLN